MFSGSCLRAQQSCTYPSADLYVGVRVRYILLVRRLLNPFGSKFQLLNADTQQLVFKAMWLKPQPAEAASATLFQLAFVLTSSFLNTSPSLSNRITTDSAGHLLHFLVFQAMDLRRDIMYEQTFSSVLLEPVNCLSFSFSSSHLNITSLSSDD